MKAKKPKEADERISINNVQTHENAVFCFRYFINNCLDKCSEKQTKDFIQRLQRIAELGWKEICQSRRHDYGFELLPIEQIKLKLPQYVTPDIKKVMIFRYNNENNPFIAIRTENILRIIAIEAKFGDVYSHS